jgi:hypothetical protein
VGITSHQNNEAIFNLLADLKNQTYKDFVCFLTVSDSIKEYIERVLSFDLKWAGYLIDKNYNDFGHEKRAKILSVSNEKYTCFLNCDDRYYPTFFEKLIEKAENENLDFVICNEKNNKFGGILNCQPQVNHISSGGFIAKTEFAKKIGYNYRSYQADGLFIEDLVKNQAKWGKVDEVLWEHN